LILDDFLLEFIKPFEVLASVRYHESPFSLAGRKTLIHLTELAVDLGKAPEVA
jgi:hypothetical protein